MQNDDCGNCDDLDKGPLSDNTSAVTTVDKGHSSGTGWKAPGPSDISSHPAAGPTQPRLLSYPSTEKCGQKRGCRSAWFEQYYWLEYSVLLNVIFCFACRHFGAGWGEQSYTMGGFQNWKKAHYSDGGLPQHAKCEYHMTTMLKIEIFLYCEGLIVSVHIDYTRHGCAVGLDYTVAVLFQPVSSLLLEQHFQLIHWQYTGFMEASGDDLSMWPWWSGNTYHLCSSGDQWELQLQARISATMRK